MESNIHSLLGCQPGASIEEIKAAYRSIVKECHPDLLRAAGLSSDLVFSGKKLFEEIREAYDKFLLSLSPL